MRVDEFKSRQYIYDREYMIEKMKYIYDRENEVH